MSNTLEDVNRRTRYIAGSLTVRRHDAAPHQPIRKNARNGDMVKTRESKFCKYCGREFHWRKKWSKDWASVQYCSKRCRNHRKGSQIGALEDFILGELRTHRGSVKFAEILANFEPQKKGVNEEDLKAAARRLYAANRVIWKQRNINVDPSVCKGLFELKLVKS